MLSKTCIFLDSPGILRTEDDVAGHCAGMPIWVSNAASFYPKSMLFGRREGQESAGVAEQGKEGKRRE